MKTKATYLQAVSAVMMLSASLGVNPNVLMPSTGCARDQRMMENWVASSLTQEEKVLLPGGDMWYYTPFLFQNRWKMINGHC